MARMKPHDPTPANEDATEIAHSAIGGTASVIGFCDSRSGKAGCFGERRVSHYGGYWFCGICWRHRKRLAKQLDAERRRKT